jgi:ABC-type nitrate/sulfonate/bicarbonate transport system ATPase subunit
MTQPLLAAHALALGYRGGAPPIFADLDLEMRAREIVALVGVSGCGKSSLLGLLAGLGTLTTSTRPCGWPTGSCRWACDRHGSPGNGN